MAAARGYTYHYNIIHVVRHRITVPPRAQDVLYILIAPDDFLKFHFATLTSFFFSCSKFFFLRREWLMFVVPSRGVVQSAATTVRLFYRLASSAPPRHHFFSHPRCFHAQRFFFLLFLLTPPPLVTARGSRARTRIIRIFYFIYYSEHTFSQASPKPSRAL